MTTELKIYVRAFVVHLYDHHIGMERDELIVLDKTQLQAAQLVGQSSKELIERICDRSGYTALHIGKPQKQQITLNLEELYQTNSRIQRERVNP